MVSPPRKHNPSRAFLHRQSWPTHLDPAPVAAAAADRKRSKSRKKSG
jgi:hypothetical protein